MSKKQLVKINVHTIGGAETNAVNGRDLWQALESKQQFTDWIKSRIENFGFVENEDYLLHKFMKQVPHQGGQRNQDKIDYILTTEMAKELAMVENNEQGRQIRKYFIASEKKLISLLKQRMTCSHKYHNEHLKIKEVIEKILEQVPQIVESYDQEQNKIGDVIYQTGHVVQSCTLMFEVAKIYADTATSEESKIFLKGVVNKFKKDLNNLVDCANELLSEYQYFSRLHRGMLDQSFKLEKFAERTEETFRKISEVENEID